MSERGKITEWDPARGWGTIRLDGGAELRFKQTACLDGTPPAVGAVIYVHEQQPYLGTQRRATAISATATPVPGVRFRAELETELHDRITRELGRYFDPRPYGRVAHFDRVLAQLGVAVNTAALAVDEEPLGVLYEPENLVAATPFDPCFVAFGGRDGDAWGALCYPTLLARGECPIVAWSHDGEPIAFEAPSFAHWLTVRAAAALPDRTVRAAWLADRGIAAPAPGPTAPLEQAVRAIVAGGPPAVSEERGALAAYLTSGPHEHVHRLDALIAVYRRLDWPAPLVERALVQRASLLAEEAHAAAVARITREHRAAHPDVYGPS